MAAKPRRIVWSHVITVISAAVLIGAEVFGGAFAASWAIATLADLGGLWARVLDVVLMLCGVRRVVRVAVRKKLRKFSCAAN